MNQFRRTPFFSLVCALVTTSLILSFGTGCTPEKKNTSDEDATAVDAASDVGLDGVGPIDDAQAADATEDTGLTDGSIKDSESSDTSADDTMNSDSEADSQIMDASNDVENDIDDAQIDAIEEIEEDTGTPLLPCEPECAEGEICADGLCLKDCGPSFDALALKNSLAEGVEVLASICTKEPFSFIPLTASSFLELSLESSSPSSYMYLNQVDYSDDAEPAITFLSSAELPGNIDTFDVFPNDYLAIDTLKEIAIFGYVGSFAQGMNGTIFMADLVQPGGLTTNIDAPGHFQASVVDSTTLLVNGQGVAGTNQGPGIYRVKVVDGQTTVAKAATNIGIGGGIVSVHGTIVLLSGHADPWPTECNGVPVVNTVQGTRVFVADLGALLSAADAGTPIDAFCSMEKVALPSELIFHPGGDVLGRDVETGNYLSRYSLTKIANGKVFVTGTQSLAIGPTISGGRGVVGSNIVALSHSHGYLLVQ